MTKQRKGGAVNVTEPYRTEKNDVVEMQRRSDKFQDKALEGKSAIASTKKNCSDNKRSNEAVG